MKIRNLASLAMSGQSSCPVPCVAIERSEAFATGGIPLRARGAKRGFGLSHSTTGEAVGSVQLTQFHTGRAEATVASAHEERFSGGEVWRRHMRIEMQPRDLYARAQPTGVARKRKQFVCLGIVLRQGHTGRDEAAVSVGAGASRCSVRVVAMIIAVTRFCVVSTMVICVVVAVTGFFCVVIAVTGFCVVVAVTGLCVIITVTISMATAKAVPVVVRRVPTV